MDNDRKYFLPYQYDWITDPRPLKIAEKSRQIGITFADAYHSVRIASNKGARYDVFVSSRDKFQAKLYIHDPTEGGSQNSGVPTTAFGHYYQRHHGEQAARAKGRALAI